MSANLSPELRGLLAERHFRWRLNARPDQLAPDWPWSVWLLLAGRGSGKTRSGAELVRHWATSGRCRRMALVAATASDVRDVMIEGESGILAIHPKRERPTWSAYRRRLTWPNGAMALTYSAEEPDRLRGPQQDGAWADELAAWRYPESWDQLMFGLRLGSNPQCVVTTTPRPTPIIKGLVARAKLDAPDVAISTASTFANADNLAATYLEQMRRRYEGTTLGRQELLAEILDDSEGALWKREMIDAHRVMQAPDLRRIVVGVDPAVSALATSDETGIVVAGGSGAQGYVLDDVSLRGSPVEWARAAVTAYHKHKADAIVAEVNQGGDMVETTIRTVDPNVRVIKVHAARGKATRAEPVVSLYEQGRVHHFGVFAQLEDQMCTWAPATSADSPDRVDALVWALSELMLDESRAATVRHLPI